MSRAGVVTHVPDVIHLGEADVGKEADLATGPQKIGVLHAR